jgi:hypothetical protein
MRKMKQSIKRNQKKPNQKDITIICLAKVRARAQSAMEYLMTYGWAILIIAIVLVALFSLGVFNAANFAPKAQPGACQVFRSNAQTSLVGQCNGELPEYVATLGFGGNTYGLGVPSQLNIHDLSQITLTFWYDQQTTASCWPHVVGFGNFNTACGYNCFDVYACQNSVGFAANTITGPDTDVQSATINLNRWYFLGLTFSGSLSSNNLVSYLNGNPLGSANLQGTIPLSSEGVPLAIGYCCGSGNGLISNIQIYNTSLSANEIQALYQEGIGGAPIYLQNLVAWYPLNGNEDYSGNNNAPINGITFISSWESGYTPP